MVDHPPGTRFVLIHILASLLNTLPITLAHLFQFAVCGSWMDNGNSVMDGNSVTLSC